MDGVVHFEIPVGDMQRAQRFYSAVFGWKANQLPEEGYTMLYTTEADETTGRPKSPGAINGGMMKRGRSLGSPIITINVANIDEAIAKISAEGGKQVRKKTKVMDVGYAAYFKDTEGNVLGLWQPIMK